MWFLDTVTRALVDHLQGKLPDHITVQVVPKDNPYWMVTVNGKIVETIQPRRIPVGEAIMRVGYGHKTDTLVIWEHE